MKNGAACPNVPVATQPHNFNSGQTSAAPALISLRLGILGARLQGPIDDDEGRGGFSGIGQRITANSHYPQNLSFQLKDCVF
jgi:hypothetical protein